MRDSGRDLIIVGGGIAGMTAAIYAARAGVGVRVLEKTVCGGIANSSWRVENFPSYQAISGTELMQKIRSHVQSLDVEVEEVTAVEDIDFVSATKSVMTSTARYEANALVIATGSTPNRLPVHTGCEERVHYCALCDGPAYRGKDVVVVGGGNAGFDESLYLVNLGVRSVVILECLETCRAEWSAQQRARSTGRIAARTHSCVAAIVPEGERLRVSVEDVRRGSSEAIVADGVFVFIGQTPNTAVLRGKVELDPAGYIVTDSGMRTSRRGVFAAGDVVAKKYRQLTTAMADGTIAALEAAAYLRDHG